MCEKKTANLQIQNTIMTNCQNKKNMFGFVTRYCKFMFGFVTN